MRRSLLAVVGLAGVFLLGAPAASAQAQVEDSVTGTSAPPSSASFYQFDAHSGPSGENPRGNVDLVFPPSSRIPATVKCLAVTGTRATIVVDILDLGAFATFWVEDNDGAGADRFALVASDAIDCSVPTPPDVVWQTSTGDIEIVDAQPFPTSKQQCKNGGWRNYGTAFKNEGLCVAFVQRGVKPAP
jgi:hypothetical protein